MIADGSNGRFCQYGIVGEKLGELRIVGRFN